MRKRKLYPSLERDRFFSIAGIEIQAGEHVGSGELLIDDFIKTFSPSCKPFVPNKGTEFDSIRYFCSCICHEKLRTDENSRL